MVAKILKTWSQLSWGKVQKITLIIILNVISLTWKILGKESNP